MYSADRGVVGVVGVGRNRIESQLVLIPVRILDVCGIVNVQRSRIPADAAAADTENVVQAWFLVVGSLRIDIDAIGQIHIGFDEVACREVQVQNLLPPAGIDHILRLHGREL